MQIDTSQNTMSQYALQTQEIKDIPPPQKKITTKQKTRQHCKRNTRIRLVESEKAVRKGKLRPENWEAMEGVKTGNLEIGNSH